MDHPDEPRYSELGTDGSRPPGSSWGVFGADDEVGTLNRVTTDAIVRAASLVTSGQVFSLNWEIDKPSPPVFGRRSPIHHVEGNSMSNEDYYDDFFPQASTQWDSLSHIRHLELGYYNGIDRQETPIAGGHRLGIQNWAERGIVGRFVLLDVARHRAATRAPLDYGVRTAIGPDELDAVMRAQGVTFQTGDILLLRFGWTEWYDGLDQPAREAFAAHDPFPSPGLEQGERMAGWLWDNGIAAVVADCPAVEATPFDVSYADGFLHYRLIALLGFALGELFALGDLARHCADVQRYTGLFTAAPIQMVGGVGSPGNALAIM